MVDPAVPARDESYLDSYHNASTRDANFRLRPPTPHGLPISKWNLRYDGESASLTSFLVRVEELRIPRGFSKADLFNSAVEIFQGDAPSGSEHRDHQ